MEAMLLTPSENAAAGGGGAAAQTIRFEKSC